MLAVFSVYFFSVSYSNFLYTFKLCWSFFRQSFSYANLVLAEFPEKNTALCAFIHHRRQRPSLQSGVIDMVATEAWLAGKIFFLFHHVRGVSCFWHRFHDVMWFRFRFRDKKKKKRSMKAGLRTSNIEYNRGRQTRCQNLFRSKVCIIYFAC